jgi:hypothetical protein
MSAFENGLLYFPAGFGGSSAIVSKNAVTAVYSDPSDPYSKSRVAVYGIKEHILVSISVEKVWEIINASGTSGVSVEEPAE